MPARSFKNLRWIGMSIILCFSLFLPACGPAGSPAASRATTAPAVEQEPTSQPPTPAPTQTPAVTLQEYTNEDVGFSLRYPKGFEIQQNAPHSLTFLAPESTQGERVRGWMEVERNLDQDAEWYVKQEKQGLEDLGSQIASQVTTARKVVDGQQAYILDRMPGQDLSRQVYVVYKGFLYHLAFAPDDPAQGEAYEQMETLYAAVINSLRFLPERREVAPVTSIFNMVYQIERASETRSEEDITRLLGDEFVLGVWDPKTPERFLSPSYGRNDVARLLLDEHLSQSPGMTSQYLVDWASLTGDPELFFKLFPNENITPVLMKGWGAQGGDEAAVIIARRMDGSLYWRGIYIASGPFAP